MSKVLIIAEAGVNHNGSLAMAKKLVEAAAMAGADIVKFQTFVADQLVSAQATKADYQLEANDDSTQLEMLKKLELTHDSHYDLIDHCKKNKILFFSTAFDELSIDFLASLNLNLWKIPSGEITNLPYLKKIGKFNQRVVISTGMSTIEEVHEAINILIEAGTEKNKITVLHCNTEYPTPMVDVNLRAMLTIQKETGLEVGYSDHTLGIEVPIAAVALGAVVIEKHFTLDRTLPGPDHRASLEPNELRAMVSAIRNIESAMGDGLKKPSSSELKNVLIARKSIHLKNDLAAGTSIEAEHLIMKRPGDGISPMKMPLVLGRKVIRNLSKDTKLSFADIQ
jgi:N,N'-diacetyllegionaminate synthase